MTHRLLLPAALSLLLASSALAAPVPTQPVRPLSPQAGANAARASLQLGVKALSEQQDEEARKAFNAALKADPKMVEAMLGLAELGFRSRNDAETLRWLQQAERLAPQRHEVQSVLGRFYLARKQPEKAEAALRKAVQLDEKGIAPRLDLANALLSRGAFKDALPLLQEIIKREPKHVAAHYAQGMAQLQLGAKAEGERLLKRSAELDPKSVLPWLALARAQPSGATAAPYIEEVLQREPQQFDALLLRAHWQLNEKDSQGARDSLQRAAKANTKSAEPLVRLGLLEEAEGKRAEAKRLYMTAIERDPYQPVALNNLVMLGLADKEDPGRLELMARRAVKALPDNPAVYDTLAQTLRLRKDKAGALTAAQQAVKLSPKDASLQVHLAEIQHWNGDRAAAKRSAETALSLQASGKEADRAKDLLTRL